MLRAKFYVSSIKRFSSMNWGTQIELQPVTSGSDENKAFFNATPSGKIELTVKADVADALVLGQEYYIDFEPALEPVTG